MYLSQFSSRVSPFLSLRWTLALRFTERRISGSAHGALRPMLELSLGGCALGALRPMLELSLSGCALGALRPMAELVVGERSRCNRGSFRSMRCTTARIHRKFGDQNCRFKMTKNASKKWSKSRRNIPLKNKPKQIPQRGTMLHEF